MKLIFKGHAQSRNQELSVLTDDGQDITKQLCITGVDVCIRPNAYPTVTLTCENWQVEGQVPPEQYFVNVQHNWDKPEEA